MVFIWNYKREPGRNRSLGRITSHSDTLRTFAKAGLTNRGFPSVLLACSACITFP
jgi:hypothetical protein